MNKDPVIFTKIPERESTKKNLAKCLILHYELLPIWGVSFHILFWYFIFFIAFKYSF